MKRKLNLKLVNQFGLCSDSATTSSPGSDGSNPSPHNNRAHTYIFMKTAVSSSPSACLAQLRWVQWKHVYIRPLPCSGHMHSFSSHHLPHATLAAYDYSRLNFSRGGGGGGERGPPLLASAPCALQRTSRSSRLGATYAHPQRFPGHTSLPLPSSTLSLSSLALQVCLFFC